MFNSIVSQTASRPKTPAVSKSTTTVIERKPVAAPQPAPAAVKKPVNIGNIGTSIEALTARKEGEKPKIEPRAPQIEKRNEMFDEQQLRLAWVSLCDNLPVKDSANAARMKNLEVHITEFPKIIVSISNKLLLNFMNSIRPYILSSLVQQLQNDNIELGYKLAEIEEMASKGLTHAEIFAEMQKQSEGMKALCKTFKLELV